MSLNYRTAKIAVGYGIREKNLHFMSCVGFVKRSADRNMSKMMAKLLPMLVSVVASVSFGAVGDPVTVLSPEPPIENKFCSMGLAFDGSSLYFDRCFDGNIYEISPTDGSTRRMFPTGIPELPAALSYDVKHNGLWIGTQKGTGGTRLGTCNGVGDMPIYFWSFDNDSVTLMFTISPTFFGRCILEGLAYRENDPTRDDDDELWVSDERSRTVGVFMPDMNGIFVFVRSFDATAVDARLADNTGLTIGDDKLYLSTGCTFPNMCGDVFRAAHDMVSLIPFDQLVSASDTPDNLWQSDMACDDMTFSSIGKTVMWVRTSAQCFPGVPECSLGNDVITAYEIEPGGCGQSVAVGACCVSSKVSCSNGVSQATCQSMQGTWAQGATCSEVPGCVAHEIILLDRTASMQTTRQATGNTRCFDALDTAKMDVDNFFNTHSAGSSLAVWSFTLTHAPNTGTHIDLTGGFLTDAITAKAALSSNLDGVACDGWTPLAEAMCDAVDALTAAFPDAPDQARILAISSDGDENFSAGQCSGMGSLSGSTCDDTDPFDLGSWQQLACDRIVGNAIAQVRFWGFFGGAPSASSGSIDPETGALRSASVPDTSFFTALADATGGSIVLLNDTPPPVTGPSIFGFVGACCLPDATCQESITEAECAVLGGMHQGDASTCADATGACCLSDATCQDAITAAACAGQGGTFQGTCTTCVNDVMGACCLPDSTCQDGLTPAQCTALSGTHQGGCSVCTGAPGECPAPIPTVSEWGLAAMTLLVLTAGTIILRRRMNNLERQPG